MLLVFISVSQSALMPCSILSYYSEHYYTYLIISLAKFGTGVCYALAFIVRGNVGFRDTCGKHFGPIACKDNPAPVCL